METFNDQEVGLADKRVDTAQYERYRGRKDQTDRIAIVSKGLIRAHSHYFEGNGKKALFRCLSKADAVGVCCERLKEDPRQQFGIVVFHYITDPENPGEPIDPNQLRGKLKLWVLSDKKYEELSATHKQYPLLDEPEAFATQQHDLIIKCTEEKYQKMTLTPARHAHWKKKEDWYKTLKAKENTAKSKLRLALGRTMTETEVMDLLGMSSTVNPIGNAASASDVDLSDVINGI